MDAASGSHAEARHTPGLNTAECPACQSIRQRLAQNNQGASMDAAKDEADRSMTVVVAAIVAAVVAVLVTVVMWVW